MITINFSVSELVEDLMREATNDLDFLRGDAKFICTVDNAFRFSAEEYLSGESAIENSRKAIGSLQQALHGRQFAFLVGMIVFSRLMFEQEAELQEEYRIVSGAEAERLLKSVGGE